MPTYEYRCSECGHQYETKEGFDAPSRQACPVCGAIAKRLLFPPPIVFKGSGFYITDSRKGSSATLGDGGTGGAAPKQDAASSSNGDSKPAETKPAAATASSDGSSSSS